MNQDNVIINSVAVVLRLALLIVLVGVGWNVYRRLPDDGQSRSRLAANTMSETTVQIILRESSKDARVPPNLPIELFPIDITAAQNEFFSERRPGKRLDDFLAERMGDRAPVESHFDDKGQVTVALKPGPWWIHTTLPGEQNIEWRLRVNVSGNKQTIELTPENAYTRTKRF